MFHIKSTSEEKVFKITKNIEISKVAGIGELLGGAYQWNLQLLNPNACKVAKLKPIFKKGKKVDPSNYRPISLLPLISKIIEKVVNNQTNEFLSDNKIF